MIFYICNKNFDKSEISEGKKKKLHISVTRSFSLNDNSIFYRSTLHSKKRSIRPGDNEKKNVSLYTVFLGHLKYILLRAYMSYKYRYLKNKNIVI